RGCVIVPLPGHASWAAFLHRSRGCADKSARATRISGVNSSLFDGVRYAVNRQHIRRDAVVYIVIFCITDYIVERAHHDIFELLVDHGLLPEVALAALHPLKIRSCDTAGVAEDVWDNKDMFFSEHVIGSRCRGPIRAFSENAALDVPCILAGD